MSFDIVRAVGRSKLCNLLGHLPCGRKDHHCPRHGTMRREFLPHWPTWSLNSLVAWQSKLLTDLSPHITHSTSPRTPCTVWAHYKITPVVRIMNLTSSPLKVKFMSRLPVEAEDPVSHLETSASTRVSLYFHTMHLFLDRSIGLVAIINIVNTLNRVLVENKHRCATLNHLLTHTSNTRHGFTCKHCECQSDTELSRTTYWRAHVHSCQIYIKYTYINR